MRKSNDVPGLQILVVVLRGMVVTDSIYFGSCCFAESVNCLRHVISQTGCTTAAEVRIHDGNTQYCLVEALPY